MLTIEAAIPMMLRGSLLSYAVVREFDIEDAAADFLVQRAFQNMRSDAPDPRLLYPRALSATVALPRFFDRLVIQLETRRLESDAAAERVIAAISGTKLGSIYPWCTNLPTP